MNRLVCAAAPSQHNNPLFGMQGKYAEAAALYERSQSIREKMLDPDHPDLAESLNNRAELLMAQVISLDIILQHVGRMYV